MTIPLAKAIECIIRVMPPWDEHASIGEWLIEVGKYIGTFTVAIGGTALIAVWVYVIVDWLT